MKIKIHIFFQFQEGPWGGGNQFLKSLKSELGVMGAYEENIEKADVVIINSHHLFKDLSFGTFLYFYRKVLSKKIVHRIDGPIFTIRDKDLLVDKFIFLFNNFFADGTVFQSEWSKQNCFRLGLKAPQNSIVVTNSSDQNIFKKEGRQQGTKVRLIASSWSANYNKGFRFYEYLDRTLDFNRYEFVFAGNSPIEFQNIKFLGPLSSQELSQELSSSDIYITASKNDPCSNALIEAITVGLPSVCLNSGGHPELIGKGGELFNDEKELVAQIEKVSRHLEDYISKLPHHSIQTSAFKYHKFCNSIAVSRSPGKAVKFWKFICLCFLWLVFKVVDNVRTKKNRSQARTN